MKWVIYLVSGCAVADFFILNHSINNEIDVFAPGLYIVLLLLLIIYTVSFTLLIEKKELMNRRAFLSVLILIPCFIYLFIHVFLVLFWIINLIRIVFTK